MNITLSEKKNTIAFRPVIFDIGPPINNVDINNKLYENKSYTNSNNK